MISNNINSNTIATQNKNQWQNYLQHLFQITRVNKNTFAKEILYYTPASLLQQSKGRLFHPCDWNIQDFEIGRHLGKGKYGHVYLARERKNKMVLAIKVITKKQIINEDIVFQLRRQLQIHSHLRHDNVLRMYGFFYDDKKIYILLDYAPHGQLYKILQNSEKFSEQRTARYILQLIKAVEYIHEQKIIHRDIKPENILLSIDDQIKLTDFGWSIHVSDKNKRRRTYCGTPDYICPEIASQKDYDFRLDFWCIGVLAFELAAGYAPFSGYPDRKEMVKKIREVSFKFPSHFSSQLQDFVSCFLKVRSQERISLQQAQNHPWIKKHCSNQSQRNNFQDQAKQQSLKGELI